MRKALLILLCLAPAMAVGADLTVTIPDNVHTRLPDVYGGTSLQHVQACVDACVAQWIAAYQADKAQSKLLSAAYSHATSAVQAAIEDALYVACWPAYQAANEALKQQVKDAMGEDCCVSGDIFMKTFWEFPSRGAVATALGCSG